MSFKLEVAINLNEKEKLILSNKVWKLFKFLFVDNNIRNYNSLIDEYDFLSNSLNNIFKKTNEEIKKLF